jgi:hypothetical protein
MLMADAAIAAKYKDELASGFGPSSVLLLSSMIKNISTNI